MRPGDVLTIALRGKVQILRVLAAGRRRGPPAEARQLYEVVEDRQSNPALRPARAATAKRDPAQGGPASETGG